MSRVGKNPVPIPAGVTIELKGQHLKAKGKRGELQLMVHDDVSVAKEGDALIFKPRTDSRRARMQWGTARNLASNMVRGVSDGFTVNLEINGVGYRAEVKGQEIHMTLGYSHPVVFPLPQGVTAAVERQIIITLSGADRQMLGETAAKIRMLRPPEPYKGKGIKYREEFIKRKAGKAVGSAGGK